MPRISDKINLPTNTTDIRTLGYYVQEISSRGIVAKSEEQEVYAKVKVEYGRKNVTNPATDTHTRQTLSLFGLIDVNEDQSIQVSQLGQELINYYIDEDAYSEEDRIALMLKILFRWEVLDSKRKIHPGFIITKLLCDPKLDYYITNHELAEFVMNQDFVSDQQFEQIKEYILAFRQSNKGISQYIKQTKATIFLATFVNNWGIFQAKRLDLTKAQQRLAAQYSSAADTNEFGNNEDSLDDSNIQKEFLAINAYSLNPTASFVAKLYISLLSGVKINDYLSKFGLSNDKSKPTETTASKDFNTYLTALRTKPFMLLAGISGTGKSRIVRELAFKSCPPELQDEDATTPGNYLMVEVKPNWHDSTEILGYYSNIAGQYQYTKFVKFLVKAMMFPNVPFFVCLDEMNLAPVEQYFAEFLSVLETRKHTDGHITTGTLVEAEYFKTLGAESGDGYVFTYFYPEYDKNIPYEIYKTTRLASKGLSLPDNVFIIGTVNMDDTTHQFSRKVIDRAMTIEMNGEDLNKMFGGSSALQYPADDQIMPLSEFQPKYVNADEVMEEHPEAAETLQTELVAKLEAINACLKNTPFQVSYRVLNEMCIYAGVMLDSGKDVDEAIAAAVDQITLMKILPRIEGDEDMFVSKNENKLRNLQACFAEDTASWKKLEEMITRLENSSFTRFWP